MRAIRWRAYLLFNSNISQLSINVETDNKQRSLSWREYIFLCLSREKYKRVGEVCELNCETVELNLIDARGESLESEVKFGGRNLSFFSYLSIQLSIDQIIEKENFGAWKELKSEIGGAVEVKVVPVRDASEKWFSFIDNRRSENVLQAINQTSQCLCKCN